VPGDAVAAEREPRRPQDLPVDGERRHLALVHRGLDQVIETFDVLVKTTLTAVNTFTHFGFRMLANVFGAIVTAGAVGAGGVDASGVHRGPQRAAKSG